MTPPDTAVRRKISSGARRGPLATESSLSEIFHENTKLSKTTAKAYSQRIAGLVKQPELMAMLNQAYKMYSLAEPITLERPAPRNQLEQAIYDRRSVRSFSAEALELDELSRLLYFTYGRTQENGFFRAVASGGGLYPLEVYVIAWRINGLEPGVYHYAAEDHGLHKIRRGDLRSPVGQAVYFDGVDYEDASALVVVSAVFARTTFKYQDRGYRMVLIEAGEAGHNLSLMCAHHGLGCVWLGGFSDDELNQIIGIDGVEEAALIPIIIGKRAS